MRALLLVLLGLATGCIPFAYALPPSQLEVGPAARWALPNRRAEPDPVFEARYTVTPLSLKPEWQGRPIDLGPTFSLDAGRDGTTLGGGLSLAGLVFEIPDGDAGWRFGVAGQGRILWNTAQHQLGQGLGAQGFVEHVTWTEGPYENSDRDGFVWGQSYGEGGIGAYVEGSYSRIGTVNTFTAGGGLLFRIPATVGIGFLWGWSLL